MTRSAPQCSPLTPRRGAPTTAMTDAPPSPRVSAAIAQTVANGEALQAITNDTEEEHRKLVARVAKNPNLLPIDTKGMPEADKKQLLDLWRSIVGGRGNLKIKAGITEGKFKD